MKKRIFALLLCACSMALILGSSDMSEAGAPSWYAIRGMAGGVRDMSEASRTIFNSIRTAIRDNGLSTIITYTAGENGGKGMSQVFGVNNGYLLVKSGTYSIKSGIASGKTFNYCVFITDQSGTPAAKGRIYFTDIETPYTGEALIVMEPGFFDSSAPSGMMELYCYNDGTIPSMKMALANATYNIRALAQMESDVYEVSSFIYRFADKGYYTVAYAAKKTGSNYSVAIQGADASSITPSNNGFDYVGATVSRNYGHFASDSGGILVTDSINDDADTNYPTRSVVDAMYASMTGGLLSFFNAGENLNALTISFASYPE